MALRAAVDGHFQHGRVSTLSPIHFIQLSDSLMLQLPQHCFWDRANQRSGDVDKPDLFWTRSDRARRDQLRVDELDRDSFHRCTGWVLCVLNPLIPDGIELIDLSSTDCEIIRECLRTRADWRISDKVCTYQTTRMNRSPYARAPPSPSAEASLQ